jgi:hypothetical protein
MITHQEICASGALAGTTSVPITPFCCILARNHLCAYHSLLPPSPFSDKTPQQICRPGILLSRHLDELPPSPSTQTVAKLLKETLRDASRSTLSEGHHAEVVHSPRTLYGSRDMNETGEIVYGPISSGTEIPNRILSSPTLTGRTRIGFLCAIHSVRRMISNWMVSFPVLYCLISIKS